VPPRHIALALAVTAVWGTNFVFMRIGLDHLPPILFAALRFFFVAFPAVFFVTRPAVPLGNLIAYGLLIGVGQFGLLYWAMLGQVSPGLASLLMQAQVFFTIFLAVILEGEQVRSRQWTAAAVAGSGIVVIGLFAGGSVTPLGLALTMAAALSWAGGNIVARRAKGANMLAYVIWAAPFSVPPLILLSLATEGAARDLPALTSIDPGLAAIILWQSVGNTIFGYGAWARLLARYPAALVSPFALAVPVFGMAASAFILGEPLDTWKLVGAGIVMTGLGLNALPMGRMPARI